MPRIWSSTRQHGRSLFYKLMTSFGAIVLLLVSFNFLSYTFFRTNIQNEIINNSRVNMQATVNSYETQLTLIRSIGYGILFNSKTEMLTSDTSSVNYEWTVQLRKDIQSTLTNPLLNLNNIIYYAVDAGFILEKEGSTSPELMFGKFYKSDRYSAAFWADAVQGPASFTVYPAAPFYELSVEAEKEKGRLFPIIFKNINHRSVVLMMMLDADRLYEGLHQMHDSNFQIVDAKGNLLFSSDTRDKGSELQELLPKMSAQEGYLKKGSDYYFYYRGNDSGFRYISVVPNERITDQITRLNVLLALILVAATGISIAASIWFSFKLNNPIARIVQSISQQNFSATPNSQIREIDLIRDKIGDLQQLHRDLNADLSQKNSLLTTYAYTNKLKMIHTGTGNLQMPVDTDKPFRLVLFRLHFKALLQSEMRIEQQRASYFIREYIQSHLANYYRDTITFQMEKDQILSLLFTGENQDQAPEMEAILQQLKRVFDLDRNYCLVTMAYSPLYPESADFSIAYELVSKRVKQRQLGDDSQVIIADVPSPTRWLMSPSEENEFQIHLSAGNEQQTSMLVKRLLHSLHRKQATLEQINDFAEEVIRKTLKTLASLKLSTSDDKHLDETVTDQLTDCYTLEQFEKVLDHFLANAAESIKRKKEEHDPITRFVFEFVAERYGEDFSLEQVAGRLNLTSAYLSTYFKEKTGTNFSDYVNDHRIRIAKDLLENSDMKIQEVASNVGYQNVNSFIRMFKKITGMPPGEFRKVKQLE